MASKRTATSELNHDNWNHDDDVEDAGTFQKASDDVLKRRVIKTAKRRNADVPTGSGTESMPKPIFGGFTGFSTFAPPNPNAAFSFLNNSNTVKAPPPPAPPVAAQSTPKTSTPTSSIFSTALTNGVETRSDKKSSMNMLIWDKKADKAKVNDDIDTVKETSEDRTEYYAKLKGLNESVLSWIEKHVKENPFINLKPIFTDYEKYLSDLEVKHVATNVETKKELIGLSFKSSSTNLILSSAKANTSLASTTVTNAKEDGCVKSVMTPFGNALTDSTSSAGKITFDLPSSTSPNILKTIAEDKTPSFVFSKIGSSTGATSSKPFMFGTGVGSERSSVFATKPSTTSSSMFGFGGGGAPAATESGESSSAGVGDDNPVDDEEPPAVEFTPVVEDEHVYSVRCKVFVKKEGAFGDRGVGKLFLKRVPDSPKTQLLVRADTNLGNLLCNLILSAAVPTQRVGARDVMLVCVPMPEDMPPPVPLLLRVKTTEEADALLRELEKYKN